MELEDGVRNLLGGKEDIGGVNTELDQVRETLAEMEYEKLPQEGAEQQDKSAEVMQKTGTLEEGVRNAPGVKEVTKKTGSVKKMRMEEGVRKANGVKDDDPE